MMKEVVKDVKLDCLFVEKEQYTLMGAFLAVYKMLWTGKKQKRGTNGVSGGSLTTPAGAICLRSASKNNP